MRLSRARLERLSKRASRMRGVPAMWLDALTTRELVRRACDVAARHDIGGDELAKWAMSIVAAVLPTAADPQEVCAHLRSMYSTQELSDDALGRLHRVLRGRLPRPE